jgi:hypothetical protein
MTATLWKMRPTSHQLSADFLLISFLVGLDVVARLLPHAPNFTPVAASALFAATVLRNRALAVIVPLAAMLLSDLVIGADDWRVATVIYASLTLPAVLGICAGRSGRHAILVPVLLSCSSFFFAASNFAVWAFSGMYPLDAVGLLKCYVAALPFLQYTVAGDVFWGAALFGGFWLVQSLRGAARRSVPERRLAVPRA